MSALVVPRFFPVPVAVSWRAFHEAGHVVEAAALGCVVDSARIHEHGGSTWILGGSARKRLLVALAGNAAERLLDVRDSDVRCSSDDYRKAFLYGIEVAREEERSAPVSVSPLVQKPPVPAPSRVVRALSAFSVAEVEAGASRVAERVAARWVERAGVLVAEGELEVYGVLNTNRRALRRVAEGLERRHGRLDGAEIAALIEQHRRKQA